MTMEHLLQTHELFRTLFEVLPTSVILVDHDARVIAINSAGQKLFHVNDNEARMQLCGHAFQCVNAANPGDCGQTVFCKDCLLRKAIQLTGEGQAVVRNKGSFHTWGNQELITHHIMVTSTCLEYHGHTLALIIIEDIANITRLQGLLPICCNCHRIRDRQGDWNRLEDYIETHSEAGFTHDLCPICSEQMKTQAGLK